MSVTVTRETLRFVPAVSLLGTNRLRPWEAVVAWHACWRLLQGHPITENTSPRIQRTECRSHRCHVVYIRCVGDSSSVVRGPRWKHIPTRNTHDSEGIAFQDRMRKLMQKLPHDNKYPVTVNGTTQDAMPEWRLPWYTVGNTAPALSQAPFPALLTANAF